jgi:hypothetical protein
MPRHAQEMEERRLTLLIEQMELQLRSRTLAGCSFRFKSKAPVTDHHTTKSKLPFADMYPCSAYDAKQDLHDAGTYCDETPAVAHLRRYAPAPGFGVVAIPVADSAHEQPRSSAELLQAVTSLAKQFVLSPSVDTTIPMAELGLDSISVTEVEGGLRDIFNDDDFSIGNHMQSSIGQLVEQMASSYLDAPARCDGIAQLGGACPLPSVVQYPLSHQQIELWANIKSDPAGADWNAMVVEFSGGLLSYLRLTRAVVTALSHWPALYYRLRATGSFDMWELTPILQVGWNCAPSFSGCQAPFVYVSVRSLTARAEESSEATLTVRSEGFELATSFTLPRHVTSITLPRHVTSFTLPRHTHVR